MRAKFVKSDNTTPEAVLGYSLVLFVMALFAKCAAAMVPGNKEFLCVRIEAVTTVENKRSFTWKQIANMVCPAYKVPVVVQSP